MKNGVRELGAQGVRVPDGFAVTAEAYREFMRSTGLDLKVRKLLEGLEKRNIDDLQSRGKQIRRAILESTIPEDITSQIVAAYRRMNAGREHPVDVAVRSSATAEDLPGHTQPDCHGDVSLKGNGPKTCHRPRSR